MKSIEKMRIFYYFYAKTKKRIKNIKKFSKKVLTNTKYRGIIVKRSANGGIAQLARATGSYPVGHGFKSNSRYQRPVGQAAKTLASHAGNMGSIPVRVTKTKTTPKGVVFCFVSRVK